MSVPYMGSKRGSAQQIYNVIVNFTRDRSDKVLVDLFCGGFAISEVFLKNGYKVIANDKNKYVVALLEQTIFRGLDDAKVLEFVDRKKFMDVMNAQDEYDDWYVGYIQCIWSFGNNQRDYMFGKGVEHIKKAGHELVVNKNQAPIKNLRLGVPQQYIDGVLKQRDWQTRRIALRIVASKLRNSGVCLQQLEQLQQLQRLERLQQLSIYSKDYKLINIPDNSIIYCDPPYSGTAEYKEGGFNHQEFWQWAREKSKTHRVFISEYKAPDDFESIYAFPRKSTLQGGSQKHDNQPKERIFTFKGVE